ncbi:MAG: PIN domain-containing protein [Deltaproteobacteria bacterium]|nr:PIN domain-containing protein [Deltaproteobacteria bacterium]
MILCDVNVYLHAMLAASEYHARCKAELESVLTPDSGQTLAVASSIMASVVRIATHPRIFKPAARACDVFEFIETILQNPSVVRIAPQTRHWRIYRDLVNTHGLTGSDTTDAWLAALALEHACEWWTTDRGFARFDGLAWRCLLD